MNKKDLMLTFIKEIYDSKLMTIFIKNIFDYENFNDYNYLFRMIENNQEIIIDIYDNVSDNRFNRYIFSFEELNYDFKVIEEGNVFVNYINILKLDNPDNKLLKLGYLFKLNDNEMIEYAKTFLPDVIVKKLKYTMKKPI